MNRAALRELLPLEIIENLQNLSRVFGKPKAIAIFIDEKKVYVNGTFCKAKLNQKTLEERF